MPCRISDDAIEDYAMGKMGGSRLEAFEIHLLLCHECQLAVQKADSFLSAFWYGWGTNHGRSSAITQDGAPITPLRLSSSARVALMKPMRAKQRTQPPILKFKTHLPQCSIEAAAGKFGRQMATKPEGWVEVVSDVALQPDMFITHVSGHSMEPLIPDGSLCAFQGNVNESWDGKILLIEQYGESGGSRYTVTRVRAVKEVEPLKGKEEGKLHQAVMLEPINPLYSPWMVPPTAKIHAVGEFLFVVASTHASSEESVEESQTKPFGWCE